MGFGFSFYTALSIIIIGNLSYFLLGLASLQGPETGTTAFMISRAPFGTRGSRLAQLLQLDHPAGLRDRGPHPHRRARDRSWSRWPACTSTSPTKVIFIILAAAIQAVMPYLGHATMVKVLRALIIPFGAIFVALRDLRHQARGGALQGQSYGHGWELYTAGLAFTFALSGLGWTECGNDYTRYIPRDAKKGAIVGWIFLGTAVPEIFMMTLGAVIFTFLLEQFAVGTASNPFEALQGQHLIPEWVVVVFLVFAIVQLFGINSLDLYSSGVSLQAHGASPQALPGRRPGQHPRVRLSPSGRCSSRRSRST